MKRIFLLDPEEVTRRALSDRLGLDGHRVIECGDGAEATGHFVQGADVAILCGVGPNQDGLHLLRQLRALDAKAPILMLANSPEELLAALQEGAYYVTRPPWTPDEVSLLVRRALTSAPRPEAESGIDYRLPTSGVNFRELERAVLTQALQLASGNQTRAASLLRLTRDQIRYRMQKFGMMPRERDAQVA